MGSSSSVQVTDRPCAPKNTKNPYRSPLQILGNRFGKKIEFSEIFERKNYLKAYELGALDDVRGLRNRSRRLGRKEGGTRHGFAPI